MNNKYGALAIASMWVGAGIGTAFSGSGEAPFACAVIGTFMITLLLVME